MYCNIHGGKSKIVENKLLNQDFLDVVSQYDIIGLGELHTQEDIDIPAYHLIKQKNRRRTHRGVAVLVKHDILGICNSEKKSNENSIWISIKQNRTMSKKKCFFGFYYCR